MSEPHDCQKCCLSFSSLEEHRQHIQDYHPKEFHKCPTCNKVFTSSALLEKHKATHSGAKPFSCDLCNKSYQVGGDGSATQLCGDSQGSGVDCVIYVYVFLCCHSNSPVCGTITGPTTLMCLLTTPGSSRPWSSVMSASNSFPTLPVWPNTRLLSTKVRPTQVDIIR